MSPLSNDWRSSNQLLERCTWWSCRLWSCLTLTPVTAAGAARRSDTDIQRQNRTSFILYSSFIWKKNKNVMRNQCPASPTLKLNTFGLVWGQRWRQFYCHKLKERKVLTVVYSETFLHFTSKKNKKKTTWCQSDTDPHLKAFTWAGFTASFLSGHRETHRSYRFQTKAPSLLYTINFTTIYRWTLASDPHWNHQTAQKNKKEKKKKKAFGFFCSVGNAAC